jgi:hypothetical protein
MSKLKFNFATFQTPPDLYRWAAPNGYVVTAYNLDEWHRAIRKFCKDNDIALEEGWEAEAEDRLCRVLPPGWCKYEDGGTPQTYLNVRFGAGELSQGAEAVAKIALTPNALVDQETAEARARTCASCSANVKVNGCYSCYNIVDAIFRVKGARKTGADSVLNGCGVCKCSLKSLVWIRDDLLDELTTPEKREQYASLPWCWRNSLQNPS